MPEETNNHQLLSDVLYRRLERLSLKARRIRSGMIQGERRNVTRRGASIEFADYRNYSVGDDLRKLDWNLYARLERPYIKLHEDERDLTVNLLLDNSASMDWQPRDADADENKHRFATRLMAGLATISLRTGDRLTLATLSDDAPQRLGAIRGRANHLKMLQFVRQIPANGITDLNASLADFAQRERGAGLTFIISDMFSPSGYVDGLHALLSRGHEVVVIHLLSEDEVAPNLTGDIRLVDIETGDTREVSITPSMRHLYSERLQNWLNGIRDECFKRGVHYVMVTTNTPFERVILHELRRLGVVG